MVKYGEVKEATAMHDPKLRIFYLRDYFLVHTDEAHPVTVPKLLAYLQNLGISSDRRTVYSDIGRLQNMGMDIVKRRGKTYDYYLAKRDFELPELKLLVDAVQSCRFLTLKKSDALIHKLTRLTSCHQATQLERQVYVQNRVKTDNERIYYNVDSIHNAIQQSKKISFQYCQYTLDKSLKPRRGGAQYVVSPYLLAWADDNYYLIADHPEHGALAHFRVDKMLGVNVVDAPRATPQSPLDPAAYAKSMFSMYAGDRQWVEVQFDRALIGVAIDRFGTDVQIVRTDASTFTIRALVTVSPAFFGWLFQFGDQALILSPANVRADMAALLGRISTAYLPQA